MRFPLPFRTPFPLLSLRVALVLRRAGQFMTVISADAVLMDSIVVDDEAGAKERDKRGACASESEFGTAFSAGR